MGPAYEGSLSELDALLNEANSQAANHEAQIGTLENENAVLLKKIRAADTLSVVMAKGGGQAVSFIPITD